MTGGVSVNNVALLRLKAYFEPVTYILEWKRLQKYQGFLIQWLEASAIDGRVHCVFKNTFVRSGRLSSEQPNMQQVALEHRDLFVAPPGMVLVAGDYSQL